MLLAKKGIQKAIDKGYILISPLIEQNINPNSVDLTLGNHFYTLQDTHRLVDLLDSQTANSLFIHSYHDDDSPYILEPYSYCLTHTKEIAGAYEKYSTLLKSRSTIARCGIDICPSAGFGDVGYVNYWTLEIKNQTPNNIILYPRIRICQIAFLKLEGFDKENNYSGAYKQREINQKEILWKPEDMLPKLGINRVF